MNETLTSDERAAVRKLLSKIGEAKLVHTFGVSTESILRVLADLPVRAGTAMMVREGLRKAKEQK